MFSATMFEGVEELAQSVLRDPLKVHGKHLLMFANFNLQCVLRCFNKLALIHWYYKPNVQRSPNPFSGISRFIRLVFAQVVVGVRNSGANTINQRLVFVGREEGKLLAIRNIVHEGLKPPVLIFLQSKGLFWILHGLFFTLSDTDFHIFHTQTVQNNCTTSFYTMESTSG